VVELGLADLYYPINNDLRPAQEVQYRTMSIPACGSSISVRETPLILIALLQPID
jgi:hypothetical protein